MSEFDKIKIKQLELSYSDLGFPEFGRTVGITIDGSGSPITTGIKGYATIPYNGIIDSWYLVSDTLGSCVIDVWLNNNIPTISNSITGINKPTLSTQQINSSVDLSGWTQINVSSGNVIAFYVESTSIVTKINLILKLLIV